MVHYFGWLEHELKAYKTACLAGYSDEVRQPHWATSFVRAAMQEVIAQKSQSIPLQPHRHHMQQRTTSAIEGWLAL